MNAAHHRETAWIPAAAGRPRNFRAHRPITARMTKLLSLPDPSHDVYAALWLGALLIASGTSRLRRGSSRARRSIEDLERRR